MTAKRDQINKERIDALLELLVQTNVIDKSQAKALRHESVRDFGDAKRNLESNPPGHEVNRK